MEIKRTILVGDIHGCIDEFEELLTTISYDRLTDRLILLGDLIDRGPASAEVVRRARELDLECVMGNHEFQFMKWYRSNKQVYDTKPHYGQLSDEDVSYIARMPSYIKLDNAIAVHAGLRPNLDIEKQTKNDCLFLRYTDINGNFISLTKIHELGKEALGAHFWTEFWKGPESIIYGHNVHSFSDPLIEEVMPGVTCYGLDTGCCFGGKLTALILETKQIIQIPAKRIYYQSRI